MIHVDPTMLKSPGGIVDTAMAMFCPSDRSEYVSSGRIIISGVEVGDAVVVAVDV